MTDSLDDVDWGDASLWEDDQIERLEELLSKCQWETKDGTIIKFRKMETSHIKNCIEYIKREKLHLEHPTFADYIDAFNHELERRETECLIFANKIKNDCSLK